ncbi:MAG: fumarylacetoacetate hydrolase family protein [Steroidobacteraceae bacterium]|jgi:2-keto-4-pentenoate hydratase/2-oxohepta-3-ene-1,7-dioic acid hydratase in catechol pathway|nr:fumarylacetoacetate hydrolase family protein [Steroidobacteraceae bacterium]
MKLLRFGPKGRERPGVVDASGVIRDISTLARDIDGPALANGLASQLRAADLSRLPAVEPGVRLAEPLAGIGKFLCVGLNYSDHARESGMALPEEPVLFMKATSAVCGPEDDTIMPRGASKVDWEVELGVVIGKRASYVERERAMEYVAGFCVVNDLSERVFQLERGGQWVKGKSCDTFGPVGPWLVTADEVTTPGELRLWLDVNGQRMQDGSTRFMVFDVPYLVHYISQFMTLEPGDLISTGTPPGVGLGMNPQRWLAAGDIVELGIDGLGTQRHRMVAYDG